MINLIISLKNVTGHFPNQRCHLQADRAPILWPKPQEHQLHHFKQKRGDQLYSLVADTAVNFDPDLVKAEPSWTRFNFWLRNGLTRNKGTGFGWKLDLEQVCPLDITFLRHCQMFGRPHISLRRISSQLRKLCNEGAKIHRTLFVYRGAAVAELKVQLLRKKINEN